MNRGLLEKSWREIWPVTLGFGLLMLVVEGVISFILPSFQIELNQLLMRMGFMRRLLGALLGTPFTEELGPRLLEAVPWVHPLVLLLVFAHEITIATRIPAAEIDRGTIDLLLGLPVSRLQVYLCHSLVWALSGAALLAVGLAGNCIGFALAGASISAPARLAIAIANSYCLYLAVGAIGCLASALSDRRGRAIAAIITVVVASFLIQFLAEFWPPAKSCAFLSLLAYYRPVTILQQGAWPLGDGAVLLALALGFWTAAGMVFQRRDICTV